MLSDCSSNLCKSDSPKEPCTLCIYMQLCVRDEQKSSQKLAEENYYHDSNHPRGYLPGQGSTSTDDDLIENAPELPNREYFEDIDFVAQEFDLFFRRRPDVSSSLTEKVESRIREDRTEMEVLDSCEQPVKDKSTTEASHCMSLTNGNSDHAFQSLKPGKQPSASVNVCEKGSLENHYQALSEATKHCDSKLYQSLSFSHTSSNSREQPRKDKCTTEANHYMSLMNGDSENAYQPLKPGKQQSASVNVCEKVFGES